MTTQRLPAALAILALAYSCSVPAEPSATEAEKADRIKALLEKYPLKLQRGSGLGNHSAEFCNGVFAAMKRADKAIEYVEPVVKTDDRNNPAFARYNDGNLCPNERGLGETTYGGDIRSIGARAFRLYRIDAAKKFKNGLEEIVYGEQIIPRPNDSDSWATFTGYQQVDFARCEHYPLVAVVPHDLRTLGIREAFNAMIRYRSQYYVVELSRGADSSGEFLPIQMYAYKPSRSGIANFPLTCYWKYLTNEPSGE